MNNRIKIKPKAYEDLSRIYQYSVKQFGLKKAEEYIISIDVAFHYLLDNLGLGSDCNVISKRLFSFLAESHIIFFRRSVQEITVIRILHQPMDFKSDLKE